MQIYMMVAMFRVMYAASAGPRFILQHAKHTRHAIWLFNIVSTALLITGGQMLSEQDVSPGARDTARKLVLVGVALELSFIALAYGLIVWLLAAQPGHILRRMRSFFAAITVGALLLLARHTYRVVEFAEGTVRSGAATRKEWYFFLGDTVPMLLCAILFATVATVSHVDDARAAVGAAHDQSDGQKVGAADLAVRSVKPRAGAVDALV